MSRLAKLNPAQREAVLTLSGPLLILAGAGTGKTRVITYRMAQLIDSGIAPDRILSVTFTNKAAREMQQRTADLLGKRLPKKPHVSTFHSLCVGILRQDITVLDYPATFTIYDRGEQESVARTALRDIRVAETSIKPGDLLNRISRWKMDGVLPAAAAETAGNDFDFLAAAAYRRYQNNLRACAAVDFDDLLLLTWQIFEQHPQVLHKHQARFDHVQIDEYQDTNAMQFAIVEGLVRKHRNICVVGDDDQSIYGWRGAEIKHILGFQRVFPGTRVIRLQDNYRCTDQILALANRLVKHNRDRHDKQLVPHKFAENSVRFLEYPDEQAEAEHVVREITFLIRTKNLTPDDFCILFRTNEQPRLFETELRRQKLPYVMLGSQSFFDRKEVRDLLAYLKVIVHPQDEISLLRIINTPARGIGTSTIEKLLARAVQQGSTLWNVFESAIASGDVPKNAATALLQFRALLDKYRDRFTAEPRRMSELLRQLVDEIGYDAEIERQYKEPQQQLLRSGMVDELIDTVAQYAERTPQPTLSSFLEESALIGRDEESDKEDELQKPGIRLMTMHSAKGLEFNRVYLVGMEEGLLPHKRSLDDVAETAIEEERRLAYVGITRARDHLTLSRASNRMKWGKRRPSIPSRFLFEMRGQGPQNPAAPAVAPSSASPAATAGPGPASPPARSIPGASHG